MRKQTILIIEDEEDLLELLEYHLQKEGYETLGFLSTKNVEKCLQEEPIDLLIVDRNLPGVEGSEFVKTLREKGFSQAVIFVTAKNSDTRQPLQGLRPYAPSRNDGHVRILRHAETLCVGCKHHIQQ